MASAAYSFDKADFIKMVNLTIALYGPAILIYTQQLQSGTVDYTYLGGMLLTLTMEAMRRYVQGEMAQTITPPVETPVDTIQGNPSGV